MTFFLLHLFGRKSVEINESRKTVKLKFRTGAQQAEQASSTTAGGKKESPTETPTRHTLTHTHTVTHVRTMCWAITVARWNRAQNIQNT